MLNDVSPMQFEHDWLAAQAKQVNSRTSCGVWLSGLRSIQDRQIESYEWRDGVAAALGIGAADLVLTAFTAAGLTAVIA